MFIFIYHHNVDKILSFDTQLTLLINGSDSIWLDNFSMLCTKPWVWTPLYAALLYLLVRHIKRPTLWYVLGGVALCVLVCDQVSSSIIKPLVCRPRPTHDPAIMHLVDTVNGYRGGAYGFFSSHAANTMSIAVLMSMIVRQRITTIALLLWSMLNCWTRLYLGVHFVGDILVGLVFGASVGCAIYYLIRHFTKESLNTFPSDTSVYIAVGCLSAPLFAAIVSMFW